MPFLFCSAQLYTIKSHTNYVQDITSVYIANIYTIIHGYRCETIV